MKVMPKGQICHKCEKITPFKELATWKDGEKNIVSHYSPWTCLKCKEAESNKITIEDIRTRKR